MGKGTLAPAPSSREKGARRGVGTCLGHTGAQPRAPGRPQAGALLLRPHPTRKAQGLLPTALLPQAPIGPLLPVNKDSSRDGTSLVVQQSRVCLAMQGMGV